MGVSVHDCVCNHTCPCVCDHTVHVCAHDCVCSYIFICVLVCSCVCVHDCVYVFMCVCACVFIYVCVYMIVYVFIYVHVCVCMCRLEDSFKHCSQISPTFIFVFLMGLLVDLELAKKARITGQ